MTKVERHMDICKVLNEVYEQKNHDYGDSFHDTFVEEGMAMARIRLSDKLNRFKKLSREDSEQKVNDESIRDTLLDLANYAIMTVMEMDILAEEDARTKIKKAISEHRKTYLPENSIDSGEIRYTCPVCGSLMLFEKELDRYVCDNCGAAYAVKASNGKPDTEEGTKTQLNGTLNESQAKPSLLVVCPHCGNKLTYNPKIDKYLCGGCGTMFAITRTAAVQRVDADPDPCEKCTYKGKGDWMRVCGPCRVGDAAKR